MEGFQNRQKPARQAVTMPLMPEVAEARKNHGNA